MTAAVTILTTAALAIYAPSLYVRVRNWWRAGNAELDDLIRPPLPRRRPRAHTEWARLQEFQAQARADIALESADWAAWEQEVSA